GKNRIKPERFLTIEIPLPPLADQRRIVARVDAIASRVAAARRLREQAEVEADSITASGLSHLIDELGWPTATLSDCLAENTRNGIGTKPVDIPPGVPMLRISAGTSRRDSLVEETDHKYLPVTSESVTNYHLRAGDLLACRFNGNLSFVGRFALYAGRTGAV